MSLPNEFLVGVQLLPGGNHFVLTLPPRAPMTREQALNLAAWLVVLADPLEEHFPDLLDRVRREDS